MPLDLRVQMDVTAAVKTLDALSSPRLQRAAAAALNDTAKNAQVQAVKEVAPLIGLPSRDVKQATSIATASTGHLESQFITAGRPVPLIRFKVRDQRGTGVTARIGRKTDTFHHAFIARLRGGYRGVWERQGKERGPLRQLFGPSVPGMMARHDVQAVVTRTIDAQLLKNLARQLDRQMRAAAGKAGKA